jgi:hypothetical protein
LRLREADSDFCVIGEDFSLSNESIIELIKSAFDNGLPFRFKVKGYSMLPFIRDNDVVTLSAPKKDCLSLGMPVAFVHPCSGKLVIHRIVAKRKGAYLIKGDNANIPDGLVYDKDVLGSVIKVERGSRNVTLGLGPERILITFLNHRLSFFFLLLLAHRSIRSVIRRFCRE